MARKSESSFEEGDFVVYPTHGVGRILGTEEREVAGMKLEMLVVRFEHDRMTLRVPMEKARGLGHALFPLAPATSCDHVRSAQPAFRASYRRLHVLQYPKFAQHHV